MPVDPSIITAISAAVEASPDNQALRLHLISLLLDDGQASEALRHCTILLSQQPDHLAALTKAAEAATRLGDEPRAASYRRIAAALRDEEPPPPNPEPSLDDWQFPDSITLSDAPPPPQRSEVQERVPLKLTWGDEDEEASTEFWETEQPKIKLTDVAGMETVKRRLNLAFLAPLKNPEMMRLYGKSLRGGLLMYGPPGCGKTFIARATAGELGAKFISIGLSDVLDMWIGSSEKNLHALFDSARRQAPCVLFFDEIDALGRKRSLSRHVGHTTINQLLAEMDGVNASNEGVFVLAATNHPWDVDTALRRPGRLDRTLLVLPPDEAAREAVMSFHLRGRPVDGVDLKTIAAKTNEYSGADLAHLCEAAAELAMEDSLLSGKVRPISRGDFKQALRDVRPSTRPWFEVARNYALFSNEGNVYDDLLEYLRANKLL